MSKFIFVIFSIPFIAHLIGAQNQTSLNLPWSCGTTWKWTRPGLEISWALSEFLSETAVDKDCPEKKNALNNCCVIHDECYGRQLGQKKCDDDFCECLSKGAEGSRRCSELEAPGMCQLVRFFGEAAYKASAPPFWSSCGTILSSAKSLGCTCGTYQKWERCGPFFLGYRYLCDSC